MKRDLILKIAASTMVISTTLTGCGPFGGSVASSSSKPATVKDGAKYAKKAEKALAKGQVDKAIIFAERSVAGVGTDPETRVLLGQSYLAAGRFSSAERSFLDAMDLGASDARTVLSLSLSQLGQGKVDKAKRMIENNRDSIPTADYGLAMALAGDTKAAITVLEQAIRDANVNGRTRQNLGLAYALDGRWKEAKLMASQDIKPAAVDQRIMQWAQMARPGAYEMRVASLLNVTPVKNDPGQPIRLALNAAPVVVATATPAEDYNQQVASFDSEIPLPATGPAPLADVKPLAAAKEVDVKIAKIELPASEVAEVKTEEKAAPLIKAAAEPVRVAPVAEPVPVKTAAVQSIAAVKPVLQKIAFKPRSRAISEGKHLVQLGVFSSEQNVKNAWKILSGRNSELSYFDHASSPVKAKGRTLYRLAATGFGTAEAAKAMCDGIKAKGGTCIVREVETVNPRQMVSTKPRKLASR